MRVMAKALVCVRNAWRVEGVKDQLRYWDEVR